MTKTARDLRSAAHALRTAANALDETVTALRALSDDLNEPDPELDPWPDAPLIVATCDHGVRDLFVRAAGNGGYWGASIHDGSDWHFRGEATLTDVVPVALVPSAEWEAWRKAAGRREWNRTEADLIRAADALTGGER